MEFDYCAFYKKAKGTSKIKLDVAQNLSLKAYQVKAIGNNGQRSAAPPGNFGVGNWLIISNLAIWPFIASAAIYQPWLPYERLILNTPIY